MTPRDAFELLKPSATAATSDAEKFAILKWLVMEVCISDEERADAARAKRADDADVYLSCLCMLWVVS